MRVGVRLEELASAGPACKLCWTPEMLADKSDEERKWV
jgi:hypothetical protein